MFQRSGQYKPRLSQGRDFLVGRVGRVGWVGRVGRFGLAQMCSGRMVRIEGWLVNGKPGFAMFRSFHFFS